MITLIPKEGVAFILLTLSLFLHGSWPIMLKFCPLEDDSSLATVVGSVDLQRRVYHRNVFCMYLDLANAFFLISMLPFTLALILANKSVDILVGAHSAGLVLFGLGGGALLGFGHLLLIWAQGVYGPPLPTTQALQASLTLFFALASNFQLQPALTPGVLYLGIAFLLFEVGVISNAFAQRAQYHYQKQISMLEHGVEEPKKLLEAKSLLNKKNKKKAAGGFGDDNTVATGMTSLGMTETSLGTSIGGSRMGYLESSENSESISSFGIGDLDSSMTSSLGESDSSLSISNLNASGPRPKLKKNPKDKGGSGKQARKNSLAPVSEDSEMQDSLSDGRSIADIAEEGRNKELTVEQMRASFSTLGSLGSSASSMTKGSLYSKSADYRIRELPTVMPNIERKQSCPEILVAIMSGIALGFTSAFFNVAINDPFQWSAVEWERTTDILSVARTLLLYGLGFWLTMVIGSAIRMHVESPRDENGQSGVRRAVTYYMTKDTFTDRERFAILAGLLFGIACLLQLQAGKMIGYTTAELVQAFPAISTIWCLNWFYRVDTSKRTFLVDMYILMFASYCAGLCFLILSFFSKTRDEIPAGGAPSP